MKTFFENDPITVVEQTQVSPRQTESVRGKEITNKYISYVLFGIIAVGLLVSGYYSSGITTLVFGAVMLFFITLDLSRR